MTREPRPCSPAEAVGRAIRWVESEGIYWLGAGAYKPTVIGGVLRDVPWSPAPDGRPASDCRFAIGYCYKLPPHRPGFNRGAWATVSDDVNYNSAIEDAEHEKDLFELVTDVVRPGDIVCYPTIHLPRHELPWIGHGAIVVGVGRAGAFRLAAPNYSLLDVVHCHGPPGRAPSITRANGAVFDLHAERWPKPEHTTRLLRLVA